MTHEGDRPGPGGLPTIPAPRPADLTPEPGAPRPSARQDSERPGEDPNIGLELGGRYRIERLIARGGMGRVYKATQIALERPVAVKLLKTKFKEGDPTFVKRFFLEAATCARLTHPNIVTVHDYGETEDGELFMAMEYLNGTTLSQVINKSGPFSIRRIFKVATQICRALREAHAHGIIHRDLKPGNVMIVASEEEGDFVKVLDFGLVKLVEAEEGKNILENAGFKDGGGELTRTGTLLGSPRYMSPEQIRGEALDPRTDIYSLGVIMYQMAAGRPPFSGATSVDVIYKHINEKPPRIAKPGEFFPPEFEAIILRCLEKDREKRFASMADVLTALKEARRATSSTDASQSLSLNDTTGVVSELRGKVAEGDSGSLSGELRGAAPRGSSSLRPRPGEAAFKDEALEDSAASQALDRSRVQPKPSRAPMVLGGLGLLVALIALVVGLQAQTPPAPAPAPAPPPTTPAAAPDECQVTFVSKPIGAEVHAADRLLGKTPLVINLKRAKDVATFRFKLPGYVDTTAVSDLDRPHLQIKVELPEIAPPDPPKPRPRPAVPKPSEPPPTRVEPAPGQPYRANPYE